MKEKKGYSYESHSSGYTKKRNTHYLTALLFAAVIIGLLSLCTISAHIGMHYANRKNAYRDNLVIIYEGREDYPYESPIAGQKMSHEQVAAVVSDSLVRVNAEYDDDEDNAHVSGVIFSQSGFILTVLSEVSDADSLSVTLNDGQTVKAILVQDDPQNNLAIIQIGSAKGLVPVIVGNSDVLRLGQELAVLSHKKGETFQLKYSTSVVYSVGELQSMPREIETSYFEAEVTYSYQLGGAVFNMYGELIGLINQKPGKSAVGAVFPSNAAKDAVDNMLVSSFHEFG